MYTTNDFPNQFKPVVLFDTCIFCMPCFASVQDIDSRDKNTAKKNIGIEILTYIGLTLSTAGAIVSLITLLAAK